MLLTNWTLEGKGYHFLFKKLHIILDYTITIFVYKKLKVLKQMMIDSTQKAYRQTLLKKST